MLIFAGVPERFIPLSVGFHGHGYPASCWAPVDPGRRFHREVLHGVRQERGSRRVRSCQVDVERRMKSVTGR